MGLMRTNTQAIKNQNPQVSQSFNCRRWNLAQVSRVSKIIKAISDDRKPAVNYFERRYLQVATKTKRRAGNHRVRDDLGQAAAKVRWLENVLKNAANITPRALIRVETKRAVTKIQRANVVEAEDMIRMTMCDQHGIQALQAESQRLLAKVAGSIDDNRLTGMFNQH